MSESATGTQRAQFEDVLSRLGLKAQAKRLAMDALVRLVDERIRRSIADLQAGQFSRAPATYPQVALGGGIERAATEGQRFKRETLCRPEMLAPEKAAALAGISRQALDLRRRNGQALALSHAKRGFRYPAWQFDEALAEPLMCLLPKLLHLDAWGRYLFLTRAEPLLEGRTPLEALRTGELNRVERVIGLLSSAEAA